MIKDLSDIKIDYNGTPLLEEDIPNNPTDLFTLWFDEINTSFNSQPNAMTLSTIGVNGYPQSRIVLLKSYSEKGFQFYTNYNSPKGKAIAKDNKVSLLFYWPELERQIRIEGLARKTSKTDSEAYFHSRPLDSRISACISDQSKRVKSRVELDEKAALFKAQLGDGAPERPKNWGGYNLSPINFEFWQGRPYRLHDRIVYEKIGPKWIISRIAP